MGEIVSSSEKKCCLVVLDGWGRNKESGESEILDAIEESTCENMKKLSMNYPSFLLKAHGTYVGLSSNESMGNSEVGHLTIGAGRKVLQDSVRIRKAFEENEIVQIEEITHKVFQNPREVEIIHILGIFSDGNIHGNIEDILSLCDLSLKKSKRVYIHTISDGRDTRPKEYIRYLKETQKRLPSSAYIVSVSGRFYSMDRDKRAERTSLAFSSLVDPRPREASEPFEEINQEEAIQKIEEYVNEQYSQNISDEFIVPFTLPNCMIRKNDTVVISNFRVDRIRQIYEVLKDSVNVRTMTRVFPNQEKDQVLFERPEIQNTLGDIVDAHGLIQTRIAETEKQAHVTFFFNGGKDIQHANEKRVIHPSQKVESYDQIPKMSAEKITETILSEMEQNAHLIVANYANPDMVGHTGNFEATKKAISCIDLEIGKIFHKATQCGYSLIITADHGNAEIMGDKKGIVKSHTTNPVPCIIISSGASSNNFNESTGNTSWNFSSYEEGTLADVAPSVLALLDLPVPQDMTGSSLLSK
ncbi:2,3-bisphosphoglycerate-independent phosphoglycerate mutase [Nematocida sp. LUAm3]|nr:2,3-bisphosphoglycerate-independent phosphoglycerate mutase [Nematocida sp. LUAm3]KAI5174109.1 2,3-bisphosphoglycerate-independent phosphoglycerate mutase [Nematocida sp. LUAm2]KAI5177148.1 2,3-bisphosphoglycerate-independent phosphoglycerate mutase [Nematocida sp. LUAm1]